MPDPTAVPTTPYVNVDLIVPPELRAECVAMMERLEEVAPRFNDNLLAEALDLWVRVDELETSVIRKLEEIPAPVYRGGVDGLISTLTGSLLVYEAFAAFGGFEAVVALLGRRPNGRQEDAPDGAMR